MKEKKLFESGMRLYINITNRCNVSCPFCCQYSHPQRKSYMPFELFQRIIDEHKNFEVQFEGGEPTIHPDFNKMVSYCLNHQECNKVIIQSNGIERRLLENCLINRDYKTKLIFKVSFNEYLHDLGESFKIDSNIKNYHLKLNLMDCVLFV